MRSLNANCAWIETKVLNRVDYLSLFHLNFLLPRTLFAAAQLVSGLALGIIGAVAKLFDRHDIFEMGSTMLKHGCANIVRVNLTARTNGLGALFYDVVAKLRHEYPDVTPLRRALIYPTPLSLYDF